MKKSTLLVVLGLMLCFACFISAAEHLYPDLKTSMIPEIDKQGNVTKPGLSIKLPDLVIREILIGQKCEIIVKVSNAGPGPVPSYVWTAPHTPLDSGVYLYRNGVAWGGASIWYFDPAKNLQPPGGTATYVSNLQVSGAETITAVIDKTKKIAEVNENNNKMEKQFKCKPETPGEPGDKKATWRITVAQSIPACYKPPKPTGPDFNYKLKFEFKSLPVTLPEGELIVTGKYVSNTETSSKPPLNISAATAGWGNGESHLVDWAGDQFGITKVNEKYYIMTKDDCKIGPDVKGDVTIFIEAASKDAGGIYYTDTKALIIKPCPPILTHLP